MKEELLNLIKKQLENKKKGEIIVNGISLTFGSYLASATGVYLFPISDRLNPSAFIKYSSVEDIK